MLFSHQHCCNRKARDLLVVKKVEKFLVKHKTPGKKLKMSIKEKKKEQYNRKARDLLVVKKVEKFLVKHKTPGKKLKMSKKEKKRSNTVKAVVSPSSYHCHLVPTLSTNNLTAFISK